MHLRQDRGFTLIEVIIALFIIGVSVAIAASVSATIKSSADSANENLALRIVANELDALRKGGYANLPAGGSFTDPNLAKLASASASTTVTAYNSKTKQVTAGVSWTNSKSSSQYISVTTLITSVGGL